MARKRNKNKRRSCRLCKPHKRGISNRWSPRELQLLRQFEQTFHRGGDWGRAVSGAMILITQSGIVTSPLWWWMMRVEGCAIVLYGRPDCKPRQDLFIAELNTEAEASALLEVINQGIALRAKLFRP